MLCACKTAQTLVLKTGGAVEATPRVVGQAVVVGSADGALYALDARTGKLRWKYKTEDKILGGANAAPAPNGKGVWVVVGSYDNRIHCVNAATGKAVWTYETDNYVNGMPAIEAARSSPAAATASSTSSVFPTASASTRSPSATISPARRPWTDPTPFWATTGTR
jgi:outer membrane protein assembly factor BamB